MLCGRSTVRTGIAAIHLSVGNWESGPVQAPADAAFLGGTPLISLLCVQAKLAFVPFDMAEAETEIIAGPYLEYSSVPLAVFKLTNAMMLFTLPVYLVTLFWGGFHFTGPGIVWGILKYVAILVLIVLIKHTSPRVRIDQAMGFFWKLAAPLALAGLILAEVGRSYGISWL